MKSNKIFIIVFLIQVFLLTSCTTTNQKLVASFMSKTYGMCLTDYLFYWNFKSPDTSLWKYYNTDMGWSGENDYFPASIQKIQNKTTNENESLMYRYRDDDPRNKFLANQNYEIKKSTKNIGKLINILSILSIEADILNDDIIHYDDESNYTRYFVKIIDGKISGVEILDKKISKQSLIARYQDCINDYNSILEFINQSGTIVLRYEKKQQ